MQQDDTRSREKWGGECNHQLVAKNGGAFQDPEGIHKGFPSDRGVSDAESKADCSVYNTTARRYRNLLKAKWKY